MRIADVLPLTPLQQGLLFHASAGRGPGDDVYAVQLDIRLSGHLDQHRLHDGVQTVVGRHPHLLARFSGKFDKPVDETFDPAKRLCSSQPGSGRHRPRYPLEWSFPWQNR